jgi:hypothetical protein
MKMHEMSQGTDNAREHQPIYLAFVPREKKDAKLLNFSIISM